MPYRLISPDGTQSFDLKMHVPLIVGRAPTCDLSVADPTISRRHAELVCEEDQVTLRDLGSSNGTFVNGRKIAAATLEVDDLVAFGKVAFRLAAFEATTPSAAPTVRATPLGPTNVRQMPMRDSRPNLTTLNAPTTAPGGLSRAIRSPLSAPATDKSQQKLATLLEVAKGLTRAVDVDTILTKIVGYAYQTLEVDRVAILLLDEHGELVPSGAPHCAITASPMNLSSVPPWRNTQSTISVKYSVSRLAISSGVIDSESAVKPRMSLNSTATARLSPPSRMLSGELAIRSASCGAKYRSKLLRTSVSRRIRSANSEFSIATAAIPAKATRNSRSSSVKRCVVLGVSTYSTPSTRSSLPMSGAQIADRTCCITIESPPKRSS
jgi:pSer/pThr/pTyr-binding forkhead associated (FHA) protein